MYRLLVTLFFLVSVTITKAQTKVEKFQNLFKNAHQLGVFNGNVLIAENGKTLYQQSFGDADASGTIKLDASFRFNMGSIAKEFNAVGIMMLKEKGKLALTDKVSTHIKGLPKWADSISILNLLQYTSGVPNSKWNEIKSDSQNFAFLQTIKKLDFTPGTQYAYNNNNTFLQRQIIEKLSGMPFNLFVKEKMLKPLGMRNAIVDPTMADEKIAKAFNNAKVEDALTPPISGWTSVTLSDFYKWAQAIANYRLITPESTRQILYGFAPGKQAGLGGGLIEGNTLASHIHDGTTRNYQALLVSSAKNNRVVLLLTNNQQNNLYDFNRGVQAILDDKPYAAVKKSFLNQFRNEVANLTADQLLAFYAEKQKTMANEFGFENETSLNEIGYQYLRSGKMADALLIFKKNASLFPQSANVWDSLAEVTLSTGDKANALLYYRKAYQLDPNNTTAKKMVQELWR